MKTTKTTTKAKRKAALTRRIVKPARAGVRTVHSTAKKKTHFLHPGEILLEEFLQPMGITAGRLATLIEVDRRRTTDIVAGRRDVTADTALRLARLFGTTPDFWINLQAHYDLECARDAAWAHIAATIKPLDTEHGRV